MKKVITDKINLKSFLIDRLTANNTIYRDSLSLTEFSYFNLSEFSECFYSLNTWWFFNVIRSNSPEVFLGKGILKICSKCTGERQCRKVISIKLQSNFIEITLQHGCSPVILLHNFRTPFSQNTSGWLLLKVKSWRFIICNTMTENDSKSFHLFFEILLADHVSYICFFSYTVFKMIEFLAILLQVKEGQKYD